MNPEALLFTLAAFGISETVYLIRKRRAGNAPICPIGDDCTAVLASKYSKIFGVSNDVLGFLFYVSASAITAFLVIGIEPILLWNRFFAIMVGIGAVFSLYLIYLQWRVLKAWCFWCLMSAFTVFAMALILVVK